MKNQIIDSVLKEAGIMDVVRNLASKINVKIPTKQEAIDKLNEYLTKDPETLNDALRYYNTNLKTAQLVLPNKKVMFVAMLLVMLFGYKMMARSVSDVKQQLHQVEVTQDSEIQNIMGK